MNGRCRCCCCHRCCCAVWSSSSTSVEGCCEALQHAGDAMQYMVRCSDEILQECGPQQMVRQLIAWWAGVLPVVLRLMSYMQQWLPLNATSAAAANLGSSSSSSGGPLQPCMAAQRQQQQPAQATCWGALCGCLWAWWRLRQSTPADMCVYLGRQTAAAMRITSQQTVLTVLATTYQCVLMVFCWQQHSAQISTTLDSWLRAEVTSGLFQHGRPEHAALTCRQLAAIYLREKDPAIMTARVTAAGSQERLQLFSMLCSYLKLCSYVRPVDAEAATLGHVQTAMVAAAVLSAATALGPEAAAAAAAEPQQAQTPAGANVAAAAVGSLQAVQPGTGASGMLAASVREGLFWLMLVGRSCLHWASELQQLQAGTAGALMTGVQQVNVETSIGVLQKCERWLQHGDVTARLSAAGYPAQAAVEQLTAAMTALAAVAAVSDADSALTVCQELVSQLQSLGLVLTSLAVPYACNNPACSNMAGPTELMSMSGRSCMCAGCLTARYCSRVCQKQHWKQHKSVCSNTSCLACCSGRY